MSAEDDEQAPQVRSECLAGPSASRGPVPRSDDACGGCTSQMHHVSALRNHKKKQREEKRS